MVETMWRPWKVWRTVILTALGSVCWTEYPSCGFDGQLSLVGGATGAQCQAGCEAQPQSKAMSSGGCVGDEHLVMVLC